MIRPIHPIRNYFFDTSALVKLYILEPGSRRVRDMIRSASVARPTVRVLASELIFPETASAISQALDRTDAAKRGLGSLSRRRLPAELARDLGPGSAIVFTDSSEIMAHAADLVGKHRIRGQTRSTSRRR